MKIYRDAKLIRAPVIHNGTITTNTPAMMTMKALGRTLPVFLIIDAQLNPSNASTLPPAKRIDRKLVRNSKNAPAAPEASAAAVG